MLSILEEMSNRRTEGEWSVGREAIYPVIYSMAVLELMSTHAAEVGHYSINRETSAVLYGN